MAAKQQLNATKRIFPSGGSSTACTRRRRLTSRALRELHRPRPCLVAVQTLTAAKKGSKSAFEASFFLCAAPLVQWLCGIDWKWWQKQLIQYNEKVRLHSGKYWHILAHYKIQVPKKLIFFNFGAKFFTYFLCAKKCPLAHCEPIDLVSMLQMGKQFLWLKFFPICFRILLPDAQNLIIVQVWTCQQDFKLCLFSYRNESKSCNIRFARIAAAVSLKKGRDYLNKGL